MSTPHLSRNTWPHPFPMPMHTNMWVVLTEERKHVPAHRNYLTLGFCPAFPLLILGLSPDKEHLEQRAFPNKVPCYHHKEVVNNIIKLSPSRSWYNCCEHIMLGHEGPNQFFCHQWMRWWAVRNNKDGYFSDR